jgi:hypothetical protein
MGHPGVDHNRDRRFLETGEELKSRGVEFDGALEF